MKMKKEAFPDLLISMVSAGEASGSLETAIDRMAIQFEKDAKIKSMVKKAMMYPMVLLVVAVGVMLLMITYVIPQFEDMFESIGSDLPVYTKAVLWLGDFITSKWWLIIIVIVALVFAFKTYKSTDVGRHQVDRLKLKLPVFGVLATKTACSRFSRTLSTLLKSGMSMMDALDIVADTMENVLFKDALVKVRSGVALGFELSQQLEATGLFPPMVIHMAGIGEETGNMEEMLTNVANYYDEEVEVTTQQVTALMEPIIIVVMAVMVAVLVLCIYGPMAQLYNDLG
jgi:type IV pilus assembly protein PilC